MWRNQQKVLSLLGISCMFLGPLSIEHCLTNGMAYRIGMYHRATGQQDISDRIFCLQNSGVLLKVDHGIFRKGKVAINLSNFMEDNFSTSSKLSL